MLRAEWEFRATTMTKIPPVHELRYLKIAKNYRELTGNLSCLGIDSDNIQEYSNHIYDCWFKLAEEHLDEAKKALLASSTRSIFSRSYYAAYNASKAMRYFANGTVSLKGDDHGKASVDLPDDLTNVADFSANITILYEYRLRADYDNWSDTFKNKTLTPNEAVEMAEEFVEAVRKYMSEKFGIPL